MSVPLPPRHPTPRRTHSPRRGPQSPRAQPGSPSAGTCAHRPGAPLHAISGEEVSEVEGLTPGPCLCPQESVWFILCPQLEGHQPREPPLFWPFVPLVLLASAQRPPPHHPLYRTHGWVSSTDGRHPGDRGHQGTSDIAFLFLLPSPPPPSSSFSSPLHPSVIEKCYYIIIVLSKKKTQKNSNLKSL